MTSDEGSYANVASVQAGGPIGATAADDPDTGEPGEAAACVAPATRDALGARLPKDVVRPGSDAQAATRTQLRIAGAMRLMPGVIGAKTQENVVWLPSCPFR